MFALELIVLCGCSTAYWKSVWTCAYWCFMIVSTYDLAWTDLGRVSAPTRAGFLNIFVFTVAVERYQTMKHNKVGSNVKRYYTLVLLSYHLC